jgi:hypothetical protein
MSLPRIKEHLSAIVIRQLPEFIQADYPAFNQFIKAYYQFLEQDQNAQEVLQNMKKYADIDTTIELLIKSFFSNYAAGAPFELSSDRNIFIKRIKDFYSSKGTETSYEFLFSLLFNETIDFIYPNEELLRPSDGIWERKVSLKAYSTNDTPFAFENTIVTGKLSKATAVVNKVVKYKLQGNTVFELFIDEDSIKGTFIPGEEIFSRTIKGDKTFNTTSANLYSVLTDVDIIEGSKRYQLGDTVYISTNGETLYYDEGKNADLFKNNWSIKTVFNMQQLGDLGNCSVHSFNSVPAFPILELKNLPTHTQIMYEVNWHLVDSLDGELSELSIISNTDATIKKIAFTKSFNKPPSIRYVDDNVTTKWNGSQIYSYRPWGQGKIAQDGYLTINTGWVNHSIPTLQIQHLIAANEDQTNEAMYLSHVKVWIKTDNPLVANSKGVGAIAKIAGVNRFGSITNIKINNSGVNYKANTIVYVDLPTLPLYGYYTTNNFIQSINFNNRHYFDIKDKVIISYPDDYGTSNVLYNHTNEKVFRIFSTGGESTTQPLPSGLYSDNSDDAIFRNDFGYNVSIFDKQTNSFIRHTNYLTTAISSAAEQMSADLLELQSNVIVFIHTSFDAQVNRESALDGLLYCGGSRNVITSTEFKNKSAYILVGVPGLGEETGFEKYSGEEDSSTTAWCNTDIVINDGRLIGEKTIVDSIGTVKNIILRKYSGNREGNVILYYAKPAKLRGNVSALTISESNWINTKGMLSENMRLPGRVFADENTPIYYQQYSYVIQSEHPKEEWGNYAKKFIHPAGMGLFGEVVINTKLNDVNKSVIKDITDFTRPNIQDVFLIPADRGVIVSSASTLYPPAGPTTPRTIVFEENQIAYCSNVVASDFVTVECTFTKKNNSTGEDVLFCKDNSWEVRTTGNQLYYKVRRQGFNWFIIDPDIKISLDTAYTVALSYNGYGANLYMDGVLVHQANNKVLGRTTSSQVGILSNKNTSPPKINSGGASPTTIENPGNHMIYSFNIWGKPLSNTEIFSSYLSAQGTLSK